MRHRRVRARDRTKNHASCQNNGREHDGTTRHTEPPHTLPTTNTPHAKSTWICGSVVSLLRSSVFGQHAAERQHKSFALESHRQREKESEQHIRLRRRMFCSTCAGERAVSTNAATPVIIPTTNRAPQAEKATTDFHEARHGILWAHCRTTEHGRTVSHSARSVCCATSIANVDADACVLVTITQSSRHNQHRHGILNANARALDRFKIIFVSSFAVLFSVSSFVLY